MLRNSPELPPKPDEFFAELRRRSEELGTSDRPYFVAWSSPSSEVTTGSIPARATEAVPEADEMLNQEALALAGQEKYEDAEWLFRRALEVNERLYGPENRLALTAVNNVATMLTR